VEYPMNKEMIEKNALKGKSIPEGESMSFNILKGDFIITGDHTFNFFTAPNSEKVIILGKYGKAIILGLTTKISESSDSMMSSAEDNLMDLDLSEYGFDQLDEIQSY
jgi:hypothetical protein